MRRYALALAVPLLVAACASQPDKPAGRYAIVIDPRLDARQPVRGVPPLHESLEAALAQRLDLAATPDAVDAVIVLRPGDATDRLVYEIRRGDRAVTGVAAMPRSAPGAGRTIGEQLEAQRRYEHARDSRTIQIQRRDPTISRSPNPAVTSDSAAREAGFVAIHRIADLIVEHLENL